MKVCAEVVVIDDTRQCLDKRVNRRMDEVHLIHSRTCKMPKERKDRSVSQDSSRTSPYPSSSSRVRRSTSKTPLESEENIKEWEEARTCKMPKERKDRSVSQDSSRTSPYPSSSSRVRRSTSKTPLESEENIKEWEEA
ncbi:hypothetical protein RYX36_033854, partial [Vicia faba]